MREGRYVCINLGSVFIREAAESNREGTKPFIHAHALDVGESGQTVNLLPFGLVGSNPTGGTKHSRAFSSIG